MRRSFKQMGVAILIVALIMAGIPSSTISILADTGIGTAHELMDKATDSDAKATNSNAGSVTDFDMEYATESDAPGYKVSHLRFTEDDFKKGSDGSVSFSLRDRVRDDWEELTYAVWVLSTGNSRGYQLLINGKAAGLILREPEDGDPVECVSEDTYALTGNETITVRPSDGYWEDGESLTGEIIQVELLPNDVMALAADQEEDITLLGADWFPVQNEDAQKLGNGQWIDFMILEKDGFVEDSYNLAASLSGEQKEYYLRLNDKEAGTLKAVAGEDEDSVTAVSRELLELQPGDILSVYGADGEEGFVDELKFIRRNFEVMPLSAEFRDGAYIFEAEDCVDYNYDDGVHGGDGRLSEGGYSGGASYNMAPNKSFTINMGDIANFSEGLYRMVLRADGDRTQYNISVDGNTGSSIIKRQANGWGADNSSDDYYDQILELKGRSTITISSPDNGMWGRIDYVSLIPVAPSQDGDSLKYEAELYYEWDWEKKYIDSDSEDPIAQDGEVKMANVRPGESFKILVGDSITQGTYQLVICAEGNREEYTITGGGITGEILRREIKEPTWGAEALTTGILEQPLVLKPGDEITISTGSDGGNDGYGKVDYVLLTLLETEEDPIEGIYVYEAEAYYTGNTETDQNITIIDMQPGERVKIPVKDKDLPSGNYRLSLNSNGPRTGYRIYVNDVPAGRVMRREHANPDGWGVEDLTDDEYDGVLSLKSGDVITIEAPENKEEGDNQLYGKLNSMTLTVTDGEPADPGLQEQIILHSEDWYFGATDGGGGVNLRPDDQIDYFIRREDGFGEEENYYRMIVSAGGFRTDYRILVNGEDVGSMNRADTEWGVLNSTEFDQILALKAGDILRICAPAGNWGTVADITLNRVDAPPFDGKDQESQIRVTARAGVIPFGSSLAVSVPTESQIRELYQIYGWDKNSGMFYNIHVRDSQGKLIEIWGEVTVTLPVPEKFDPDNIIIYQIFGDGSLASVEVRLTEEGKIQFTTTSLGLIGVMNFSKDLLTLEAEDYYQGTSEEQHDGAVTYIDFQPGETVDFVIPEGIEEGYYYLIVTSNGTRTAYAISVNGEARGVVKREPTGWDAEALTRDRYSGILGLKPGDRITLTAIDNLDEGDNQTFGKLDSITLITAPEPEIPVKRETITLKASDYYGGSQDSTGGMNIRPKDGIDFIIREEDGFTEGDYVISARVSGFRKNYIILVNGQRVTELMIRNSEWGKYLTGTTTATVHLKPGDRVTFYAEESWGMIDTVTFYKNGVPADNALLDRMGGRLAAKVAPESAGEKASGTEPVFYYQAEGYYQKQTDNPAADLQPGEMIEIPLSDNENFVDGLYQVTVVSCGARDHMFVKVNGRKTGRINRTPGGYGMDQMTKDSLSGLVNLQKEDLLCIEAAPVQWGWVDYVRLDLVQKSETESRGGRYEYPAMNYYSKKQDEWDVADLQPGEKIVIPINNADFGAGYYYVSVTASGDRKKMSVEVNGQELGWIQRNSNNYGFSSLVRDTMPVPVYLKPEDVVAICAPGDGGWGWVGQVDLIKAVEQ